MDSLQVKAYDRMFDDLSYETQEELLEKLLTSTTGKKVLRQRKVDDMMEWFEHPISKNLIGRCPAAEDYFLISFMYNSSWENINNDLRTWFCRDSVNTHVSDDGKIVFISPINVDVYFRKTITVDEKALILNNEFDMNLILETDFDLNNLYMGYNDVEKWWEYCHTMA
jgi:hypothetical protein